MSRGGERRGAGRPRKHAKTAGKLSLDVRRLHREGHLAGRGRVTWQWSSGASVALEASSDCVRLLYGYKDREGSWHEVNQPVAIITTRCHFGGHRPWFSCPRCGARIAILYLWHEPACRTCARLTYLSQSEDAIARSWRRTEKIAARLGHETKPLAAPCRPKGMRRTTFERLRAAWWNEEALRDRIIDEYIDRAQRMGAW